MSKMRNGIINHDRGCDQNGGSSHDNIDDDSHDCCNGEEQISTTARQVLSFDEEEAIVRGHQQQQQYQITPSEVGTYTNSGTTIHRRRPNTNTTKRARQKLPQQEELHEEQHNGNGNGVNYNHKNNNHNTRYRRRKKGTAKRKNKTSYANIETIVWSCSAIILVFWGRIIWKKFVSNDTVVDVVPWLPHQYTELPVAAASRRRVLKMQPSNNRTITTHGNIIDYHHHYSYVVGKSDNHNKNNSKKKIVIPVEEDWKDVSMIHIVNTRFMQEQGYLKELGNARLLLFQTVCLPSMVHQSTQNFIWIIKTDPKLDPTILRKLQSMLLPYPNFYLVGSNNNYLIRSTVPIKQRPNSNGTSTTTTTHPNNIDEYYDIDEDDFDDEDPKVGIAWRDGGEGYDLLQSKIYSGNLTHLYQAMALRHRLPILETRLDADDGLHQQYLQYVQSVAYQRFFTTRKRRQRQRRRRADQEDDKDDPEGREEEEVGKKNTVKEKEDDEVEGSVDDGDDDDSDSVPTTITTTNVKWLYWCARRHMEWHISVNQTSSSSKHNKKTNKKNNEVTATGEESSIASRIDAIGGGGTKTPEDDKYPMGILNPVVSRRRIRIAVAVANRQHHRGNAKEETTMPSRIFFFCPLLSCLNIYWK